MLYTIDTFEGKISWSPWNSNCMEVLLTESYLPGDILKKQDRAFFYEVQYIKKPNVYFIERIIQVDQCGEGVLKNTPWGFNVEYPYGKYMIVQRDDLVAYIVEGVPDPSNMGRVVNIAKKKISVCTGLEVCKNCPLRTRCRIPGRYREDDRCIDG